jgi:hypothetical protein
MANTVTYDTIKSHLATTFSGAGYPVIDIDKIDTALEQNTTPFIVIEEVASADENIGFGDADNLCQLETGTLTLHGFVPAPASSAVARTLGDQIQAALHLTRFANGLRVVDVTPPDLLTLNNGLWSSSGVSIFYEREYTAPLTYV